VPGSQSSERLGGQSGLPVRGRQTVGFLTELCRQNRRSTGRRGRHRGGLRTGQRRLTL